MNTLKLASGQELNYLNEVEVRIAMDESNEKDKHEKELEETDVSDITVHKYEGGFKIWEGTVDLCDFIEEKKEFFEGKRVLELGCGAALPAVLSAIYGATEVYVQDFNTTVVEFFSLPNFVCNDLEETNPELKLESIAASWEDLPKKLEGRKFDVILSSETIYNEDDYQSLHDAVAAVLANDGVAWFSAKYFYFGVGGSVPAFCEFVNKIGVLKAEEVKVIDTSVPRRIVELKRV